jgi:hypothetical protein
MAWIPTGQGLLRQMSHQGMLLAPFLGIPYNPRVLNRQLPLEYVSVFVHALEKFAEEAGSR